MITANESQVLFSSSISCLRIILYILISLSSLGFTCVTEPQRGFCSREGFGRFAASCYLTFASHGVGGSFLLF